MKSIAIFGAQSSVADKWNLIEHNFNLLNCRMKEKPATPSISLSIIIIRFHLGISKISCSKSIINNNLLPSAAQWLSSVRSIRCHSVRVRCWSRDKWRRRQGNENSTKFRLFSSYVRRPFRRTNSNKEFPSLACSTAAQWMRAVCLLWTISVPLLFGLGERSTNVCACGREHDKKNCRRNDVTINRSSRLACSSFSPCFCSTTRLSIILSIGFAFCAFVDRRRHTNPVPATNGRVFGFRILDFRHDGGDSFADPSNNFLLPSLNNVHECEACRRYVVARRVFSIFPFAIAWRWKRWRLMSSHDDKTRRRFTTFRCSWRHFSVGNYCIRCEGRVRVTGPQKKDRLVGLGAQERKCENCDFAKILTETPLECVNLFAAIVFPFYRNRK